MSYTKPFDEQTFITLISVKDFRELVKNGRLTPDDGFGFAVRFRFIDSDRVIRVERPESIPVDATHILWIPKNYRR